MTASRRRFGLTAAVIAGAAAALPAAADENTLTGWALMPAATFSEGPTTGEFATSSYAANPLPIVGQQAVQGFSAVLNGPVAGSYRVMTDNGFGTKANSADALLRSYAVMPDFKRFSGGGVVGSGTIRPIDYASGAALPGFSSGAFVNLRDPDHKLGYTIQADYTNYYGNAANPLVDRSIRSGRLLTGADLDIESTRKDKNGNVWYGDEFGPFLVKTDASGKVLRKEIPLPGVQSPDNPHLNGGTPNLGSSRGFEGMAVNPSGDRLYTLLEGTVSGDPAGSLRINEFNVDTESFSARTALYKLDPLGTNIGDMTAINDHQFLVIERNGGTATTALAPFKKIFEIDTSQLDADGYAKKTELVDLMHIADPHDLNGDGSTTFTFPYVTIESLLILDPKTILVINDNNYPGGGGRGNYADPTEFLTISLATVPEPQTVALMLAGLGVVGALARRGSTPRQGKNA